MIPTPFCANALSADGTALPTRRLMFPALLASALALAACGGGGGGEEAPAPATAAGPTAAGPTAAVANPVITPTATVSNSGIAPTAPVRTPTGSSARPENNPSAVVAPVNEGAVFGPDDPAPKSPAPVSAPVPAPVPPSTQPPGSGPAPTPGLVAAPIVTKDPATAEAARVGAWSPLMAWPIIAIHASALPDGRVMTYGTNQDGKQTGKFFYDVWQPFAGIGTGAASHLTLANQTGTDLFCSAQLVLPQSGDLLINGGDIYDTASDGTLNLPNDNVTVFRLASNNLVSAGKMHRARWYGTATTLPSGESYLQGGSGGYDRAEVRGLDGNFTLLTGFATNDIASDYPRNFVGTDGRIFGLAYEDMYRIDPSANGGTGSRTDLGRIPNTGADWTSGSVMYQPGRILQVGGTDNKATIIDIRGPVPAVSSAGTMAHIRAWPGVTVLADGKVAVTGGSASANTANRVAYQMELFDPQVGSWTPGPSAQRMRLYHSTSLLLADGSVLTAGGGAPGPQTNLNAEIYYPPYLFRQDGSPATRPVIAGAPTVVDPSANLVLTSPQASSITRVTMVATGSVTHSNDMNQRFVELDFHRDGDQLVARMPVNAFETPPGFYMVFAIDADGTPSMARIVRVNVRS